MLPFEQMDQLLRLLIDLQVLRKEFMPWLTYFHHLTWLKVGHDLKFLPTNLFVWIEFRDTRGFDGLRHLLRLEVKKQFVWLFDAFHFFDFPATRISTCQSLQIWSRLFRLEFHFFWNPFFSWFSSSHLRLDVGNFFFHVETWEDWSSFGNHCTFQGNLLGSSFQDRSPSPSQVVPRWHLRCSSWMVGSSEPQHEG